MAPPPLARRHLPTESVRGYEPLAGAGTTAVAVAVTVVIVVVAPIMVVSIVVVAIVVVAMVIIAMVVITVVPDLVRWSGARGERRGRPASLHRLQHGPPLPVAAIHGETLP
jgi:membrane protein YdbS with pleckstrin-like domain